MKKVLAGLAAGALAMGIFASTSFAAVTVDESGNGFVGKGDVQQALGWNNAQLQKNAESLLFTYETVTAYEVTVEWITGEGTKGEKKHIVEHKHTANLSATVDYNARKSNQFTGFYLNGHKDAFEGKQPAVGDEYPGKSGHIVTSVELVSSTSTLYVNGVALQ
ncbi:hypothetical protein [Mesobacillus subterraneus]|uniref:Uncharacterized protein n=1 Tax=Mesobacillus subterraneus TaxID=285983 RepID=A0A427TGS8_9BACI|nr:hypothetical protein [Mesobacillus subterraneus]RSD22323.1 hypothetical protein EJA10_21475 [Mesobacillus subterraneus]